MTLFFLVSDCVILFTCVPLIILIYLPILVQVCSVCHCPGVGFPKATMVASSVVTNRVQWDSEDLINFDLYLYSDMPCLLPSSEPPIHPKLSVCPEISVCHELSACPEATMEVIPLWLELPVMGMALGCVWAAHTFSSPPDHPELPPSLPLPPPLHQSSPFAAGLPVSIGLMAGGSLVSASGL